jgi:hypothetical protein
MIKDDRILIINSNSFIGKSINNRLIKNEYENILINNELDLNNEKVIDFYLKKQQPDIIFICFNNLHLQEKFIKVSNNYNIKQIIRFSNEKLNIESKNILISYYTDNVYGSEDNFDIRNKNGNCFDSDLKERHIIPDLLRRIYEAKIFRYPLIYLNFKYDIIHYINIDDLINHLFKTGLAQKATIDFKILEKTTIINLIKIISDIIEYDGKIIFNNNKDTIEYYSNSNYLKTKLSYLYKDLKTTNKYFLLN